METVLALMSAGRGKRVGSARRAGRSPPRGERRPICDSIHISTLSPWMALGARRTASLPGKGSAISGRAKWARCWSAWCGAWRDTFGSGHGTSRLSRLRHVDRPRADAPYNSLVHPRGWRAFTEYGNGIVGDMCVHMLDMVRWMLDLGWPTRVSSSGGIFVDKDSKANITGHPDRDLRLRRPARGLEPPVVGQPAGPEVPVGRHDLRGQGHAQGQRDELRLRARRAAGPRCTRT